MTTIGKLLRGGKGIVTGLVKTALPNIKDNIESEIGGKGKIHLPSATASWIYASIALISVVWTIYRLATGTDPIQIQQEQELINSPVQG